MKRVDVSERFAEKIEEIVNPEGEDDDREQEKYKPPNQKYDYLSHPNGDQFYEPDSSFHIPESSVGPSVQVSTFENKSQNEKNSNKNRDELKIDPVAILQIVGPRERRFIKPPIINP